MVGTGGWGGGSPEGRGSWHRPFSRNGPLTLLSPLPLVSCPALKRPLPPSRHLPFRQEQRHPSGSTSATQPPPPRPLASSPFSPGLPSPVTLSGVPGQGCHPTPRSHDSPSPPKGGRRVPAERLPRRRGGAPCVRGPVAEGGAGGFRDPSDRTRRRGPGGWGPPYLPAPVSVLRGPSGRPRSSGRRTCRARSRRPGRSVSVDVPGLTRRLQCTGGRWLVQSALLVVDADGAPPPSSARLG